MGHNTLRFQDVSLRRAVRTDLEPMYDLMTKDERWTEYNGPYFGYQKPSIDEFRTKEFHRLTTGRDALVIDYLGRAVGMVSFYWEDESTRWLELGVVVYDSTLWGKGIGSKALIPWIEHLFATLEIERVGLTTWSGNPRMIRAAQKLGLTLEAQIRKVRYYQGVYYDSVKFGVLREEWTSIYQKWMKQDRIYLFDWGDTIMVDFPQQQGKMCEWPRVEVVSGADAMLAELSQWCPVYIATNAQDSSESEIQLAFCRANLSRYISGYFCFHNLGIAKDDPEFYRTITSRLGAPANKITMTGDQWDKDIAPAAKAGLSTNWFNPSQNEVANDAQGHSSLEQVLSKERQHLL